MHEVGAILFPADHNLLQDALRVAPNHKAYITTLGLCIHESNRHEHICRGACVVAALTPTCLAPIMQAIMQMSS